MNRRIQMQEPARDSVLVDKLRPLVTVITPNWNGAAFLEQTILSVLNQTYTNVEYIVIDGGSTDESLGIIGKYQDRIACWLSEPDEGMYQAINKGVARANGDIVAYLNSDDLYFPGTISKIVSCFSDNPDVDLIYGDLDHIDERGERVYTRKYPDFQWGRFVRSNYALIGQPATFWRKRVFEKVGTFDETFKMAADFEFFIRVGRGSALMHIPDVLAAFRLHSASLTCRQVACGKEEVRRIHKQYIPDGLGVADKVASYWSDVNFKLLNWKMITAKLSMKMVRLLNV